MKPIILMQAILLIFFAGCSEKKQDTLITLADANISVQNQSDGYTLLKNNCYACHSVTTKSHDEIIAPPMIAIKRRYKMNYETKEEFVNAITNWALNPTKEHALMRGAVMQFNVMPKQPFIKDDLIKIADYLYDNELEKPEWFENHFNEQHPNGMGMGMGKGMMRRN
ncbi:MAG: c-type cytochrome [Lutibacter sp.]|nr:c-type cytochrome [Lutibacter sp.]